MNDTTTPDDIFAGTAWYYARFRPPYPPGVYEAIERAARIDGTGTLLDLGAGTGTIAMTLAPRFERVVAVDASAEMVEAGRDLAESRGITNIEWHVLPAEEIDALGGRYRLVTVGSAFHWMNRPKVLDLLYPLVEPGGAIALTGLPGFLNLDSTDVGDPLATTVARIVRKHLGEVRRAGSGVYREDPKRHEVYLEESRFTDVQIGQVDFAVDSDLESIVGHIYSTSFANRRILGDRVDAFEYDLRMALLGLEISGRFRRRFSAEWITARKPEGESDAR
ncbi:MAG: class I SAM-dependent methyltransferase [Chloroflexi bacterium]|nr:class I SAM-dependent methyltransferase [Chloroflexota bacterium]